MGQIISRFRTKPTTKELLDKIELDIQTIEDYKWSTLRKQKNLMGLIFFGSGFIYAIVAVVFYFHFLPMSSNWQDKCIYSIPLVILPAIAFMLQRALQWYYRWDIEVKEEKLKELRKEKRKMLDKIMETETYKVAKELLEKYDPSSLRDKSNSQSPNTTIPRESSLNSSIRYRSPSQNSPNGRQSGVLNTTVITPYRGPPVNRQNMQAITPNRPLNPPYRQLPPSRPARPILPQDRSVVEKLVDYVVGDGPANRFALICNYCHSHNGMALKDEFEFIAFRCCYCYAMNPARKARPFAPRLTQGDAVPIIDEPDSDKDSERCSEITKGVETIDEATLTEGEKNLNDSNIIETPENRGENKNINDNAAIEPEPVTEQKIE